MYTYGNAQGSYLRPSTKTIRQILNLILNKQRNKKSTKLHCHRSLKNRPRKIIDHLLNRMGKVKSDRITVFNVTSSDLSSTHRLKYRVDFGEENWFCKCTCNDYGRNRMLCKHFFIVVDSSKSNFYNISKPFLEHPYLNLDSALL